MAAIEETSTSVSVALLTLLGFKIKRLPKRNNSNSTDMFFPNLKITLQFTHYMEKTVDLVSCVDLLTQVNSRSLFISYLKLYSSCMLNCKLACS